MKIAFYKGTTIIDNLISWWTRGPYSHCEILFTMDPKTKIAQCASSNRGIGVAFDNITLTPAEWDIMDLPNANYQDCVKWFNDHAGEQYDYTGLLGIISPIGNEYNHWFCSEACAASLGIPEPWRFDPNRLAVVLKAMGGIWDTSFSSVANLL